MINPDLLAQKTILNQRYFRHSPLYTGFTKIKTNSVDQISVIMDKVDSKEYDGSVKDSESVEIGVDFVDEISRQCHLQDHLKTNDL